ncbi:MAG: hypothetical protein RLY87_2499 [Chloroflexota bacterium]
MSVVPPKHAIPSLSITPMDESSAARIQTWQYSGIMSRYTFSDDPFERQWLCHPDHRYYQIRDVLQQLVGFAAIGVHAQPVGALFQEDAEDILIGIRPDLVNMRRGYEVCASVTNYTKRTTRRRTLRVSLPHNHLSGLAVWQRAGFFPEYTFLSTDNTPFVVLLALSEYSEAA